MGTPSGIYVKKSNFKTRQQTNWDRFVGASVMLLELLPLVVIIGLGILLGMSRNDLLMHAFSAASTISLVHCIGTIRHVSTSIHQCNRYKNLAHRLRKDDLYELYDSILVEKLRERVIFWYYTALTTVFWIGNASCYVAYLAEHARHEPIVALEPWLFRTIAITFAVATVILATLKVWATTRCQDELEIEWFVHELKTGDNQ